MTDDGSGGDVHDWSAFRDDSGQIFYHNSKTDETSWDAPLNDEPFNPVEVKEEGDTGDVDNNADDANESGDGDEGATVTTSVSGGWVEYMDEDKGEPYYYNTVTLETVWEPPAELLGGDSSASAAAAPKEEGTKTKTITEDHGDQVETAVMKKEPVEEEVPVVDSSDSKTTTGDWIETQDDEGRTYYYNSKTEETSWDQPAGFKEEEKESKTDGDNDDDNGMSPVRPQSPVVPKEEEDEAVMVEEEIKTAGDWTEAQDDEGQSYYYNTKTNETVWDRPAAFDNEIVKEEEEEPNADGDGGVSPVSPHSPVVPKQEEDDEDDEAVVKEEQNKSAGDWVETQDDEGRMYYYNAKTNETLWDRPAAFDTENKDGEDNEMSPVRPQSPIVPKQEQEKDDEVVKEEEESPVATENKTAGDWVEIQDDEGRTYYYNSKTEETSWDRPAAFDNENKVDEDNEMSPVRPQSPVVPKEEDEAVKDEEETQAETGNRSAGDWVEAQDDEGRSYYYNSKTNETVWDRPAEFDDENKDEEDGEISPVRPQSPIPDQQEEEVSPVTAGNWVEYKDDEGRVYYYNTETQQTVWDKPSDFDDLVEKSVAGDDSDDDNGADGGMELSPTKPESPDGTSPVPMEEEPVEEEEVVDPAVKRLEEAKEALSQSDAIMETGVLSDLTEVVKSDRGNPKNAIQALSESAHGQTAVCGLLSRWLVDLKSQTSSSSSTTDAAAHTKRFQKSADDIREMTQEVVNRIVKERFTHKGGDSILALSKSEAAFLEDMMDSNRWRKLLIDLSASNKDSALLMYCLQSISKRGHHREIARRINQSEHFPVFNAMLASELAVIGKISVSACHDHDTSISLDELVGDLRRTCTSTSYTYLYGFEVLRFQIRKAKSDSLAMTEKDRLLYARVIRKWERLLEVLQGDMIDPSTSTGSTPLFRKRRLDVACTISDLHQRQRRRLHPDKDGNGERGTASTETSNGSNNNSDDRHAEIESAVSTFLRRYCLGTQIDDPLLDKMLPNALSGDETNFIGNLLVSYPISIEALLAYLYKPGQRVGLMVLRNKCARLAALAVMAAEKQSLAEARKINPNIPESESDEIALTQTLLEGSQLCEQLENMVSFIVTTDATKIKGSATNPGEQICNLAVKSAPVSQGVAMWAREITKGGEFVSSASYATISPNIMTLVRIVYLHHPFTRDNVCGVAFQFLKHANSEVVYQTMNSLKEQSLRLLIFLCTRGEAPSVFDQFMKLVKDPGRSPLDASLIRYFISGLLEVASPPFSIPFIRSFMTLLKAPASVEAVKTSYFDKNSKSRLTAIMNYLKTRATGKLDTRPLAKEDISLINSVLSIYHSTSD